MLETIFAWLLLWSLEATALIGLAAFFRKAFCKQPGNIQAAILATAILCVWLIPVSPNLVKPVLGGSFVQTASKTIHSASTYFFGHFSFSISGTNKVLKGSNTATGLQTKKDTSSFSDSTGKLKRKETSPVALTPLNPAKPDSGNTVPPSRNNSPPISYFYPFWQHFLYYLKTGLVITWLIGFIYYLFRWLYSWWSISYITAKAEERFEGEIYGMVERLRQLLFLHKQIKVKVTPVPMAPFVKGLRRPVLVLPLSLLEKSSITDLKAIIIHELAHIYRYDLEMHYAMRFLRIGLWFLPPVIWLQREFYNAQDKACDECAAVILGSGLDFGEALTHLAEHYLIQDTVFTTTGFYQNKHFLLDRLDNIATVSLPKLSAIPLRYRLSFFIGLCLSIAGTGLIGQASLSPFKEQNRAISQRANSLASNLSFPRQILKDSALEDTQNPTENPMRFSPATPFATDYKKAISMAIGDVNDDGFNDIVIGTDIGESKSIFINQEGKALVQGPEYSGTRDKITSLILTDINLDGKQKIIAASSLKPHQIFTMDKNGSLLLASTFGGTDKGTESLNAGDFNGDSFNDIAETNRYKESFVYFNDGMGNFHSGTPYAPNQDNSGNLITDVDHDGDQDIIWESQFSDTIFLSRNDSQGNFTENKIILGDNIPSNCPKVLLKNILNNTGFDLSLFVMDRGQGLLFSYENDNTFHLVSRLSIPGNGKKCAVGDVDLDGDMDFLIGMDQIRNQLFLNEGNGKFSEAVPVGQSGDNVFAVAFADMDSDGDLDIVTGNEGSPSMVYRNDLPVQVKSVNPKPNDIHIPGPAMISVEFSHKMLNGNGQNYTVYGSMSGKRQGEYRKLNDKTLSFIPSRPFFPGENIQVILTREILSTAKQPVARPYVWSYQAAASKSPSKFDSVSRTFGSPSGNATSVALGDIDGNGDIDIVTGNDKGGVIIFLNDGRGFFPDEHRIGAKVDTYDVALSDMNGDGYLDIIAGNAERYANSIFLNDGKGSFTSAPGFQPFHGSTESLASGDIDGDGRMDLIMAGNMGKNDGEHHILQNQGNGIFQETARLGKWLVAIRNFAFADINGDYSLDLLTAGYGGSNYYFLNDGNGFFLNNMHSLFTASGGGLCTGDLDGDYDVDAVGIRNFTDGSSEMILLHNNGKTGFSQSQIAKMSGIQNDIQLGDIDGDGSLDIVMASGDNNPELTLFRNNGKGEFLKEIAIHQPNANFSRLSLGDMDGDGDIDVVVSKNNGLNCIYFNQTQQAEMSKN